MPDKKRQIMDLAKAASRARRSSNFGDIGPEWQARKSGEAAAEAGSGAVAKVGETIPYTKGIEYDEPTFSGKGLADGIDISEPEFSEEVIVDPEAAIKALKKLASRKTSMEFREIPQEMGGEEMWVVPDYPKDVYDSEDFAPAGGNIQIQRSILDGPGGEQVLALAKKIADLSPKGELVGMK
jgi:hypothetical protein